MAPQLCPEQETAANVPGQGTAEPPREQCPRRLATPASRSHEFSAYSAYASRDAATACSFSPTSGVSRPRAETFSDDSTRLLRTIRATSKLFTVGQTWRGKRYKMSPTLCAVAPSATAMGKCSSLGPSGANSGCPATTQVGRPASAETDLWPASHVIRPEWG